ncbi:ergothioneine biosynthesis protein EgtB [Gilvibacter sediminis]|uniref:ergothioneine biosynthesis protein EgtB n=1 Tax=Gilvibacter sediminis TaxID=379071 RepID=UPI00234FC2DC|nr:ergothioneine biosynthesis protein EgtB [Gilvibacter sediminis]MDC7996600.1 ergothioneine biosynthesis protein EgtB [Gilvibacter sediminis]
MLRERFLKTRTRTQQICSPLKIEDYSVQPMTDASPPKWHLAHTTWFFEQFVLVPYKNEYSEFDKDFAYLFNSYYNNFGDRVMRPNRGLMTRPVVSEVLDYRAHVTDNVAELLAQEDCPDVVHELVELGINHEEQHQELLAYDIKSLFGNQPTFPLYGTVYCLPEEGKDQDYIKIPEGLYEVGYQGEDFHFDIEKGRHKVFLEAFEISNRLVTNGEFLEFIEAGGYADFNLWHAEGWEFINQHEVRAPLYWHKIKDQWHRYCLEGLVPVNPNEPVMHISFYEAAAYADWRGLRIPSEFEWEVASQQLDWGILWEWTSSAFLPYPRFEKKPGAVGEYNGKFMINQKVLRGASVATPEGHSRATYRNFFHPHLRWQFAGLRLAR